MLANIFDMQKQVLITFIASFLIWIMVGGVIYLWIFRKKIDFRFAVYIFAVWFVSWIVSEFLKRLFALERPFVVNGTIPLTLTIPRDYSFPSAHASSAFALAVSLRKYNSRLFIVYSAFAFLVSLGRVLSRVHYITDVLAGAVIGISVVVFLDKLGMEKYFKKILT